MARTTKGRTLECGSFVPAKSGVSRLDTQVTVYSISEADFRAALNTPKCEECTQLRQIVGRLSNIVEALEVKVKAIDVTTKRCARCGRLLTPDSFYDHPLYPDGLFPNCILCIPDTRLGQEVLSVEAVV